MSNPGPFSSECLGWYVCRVNLPSDYEKLPDGRHVRKMPSDTTIIDWCVENIRGRWTWGGNQCSNARPFYFEQKSDAMLFKLTWFDKMVKLSYYALTG